MFEIQVSTTSGWQPLNCSCPAGRAVFATEAAAKAALTAHQAACAPQPFAHRIAAAEPVAA